jgi:NAD(P)-dependent dehydrogenase (short-subunit alcohol dehydrogenase family)
VVVEISLEGKTAVVAGGGRGIGAAVSEYLGLAGASVVVVDKSEERATATAERIRADGGTAVPVVADLLQSSDSAEIAERAVREYGGIDILANVAGGAWAYAPVRRLHDIPDEEWDLVVGLNLRYVFTLSREVIRVMLRQGRGGSIVNVASVAGVFSSPNSSHYGAAKAGVISLTRTLAHEYGKEGIRVNSVAPGRIETPATPAASLGETDGSEYQETIPLGFVGQPIEIAKAVAFFASDLASYVTGQILMVDGGASSTPAIMPSKSRQREVTDVVRGIP